MTGTEITLVGDGVDNPANAQTMVDAAGMFGCRCLFRDRHGLAAEMAAELLAEGAESERSCEETLITYEELAHDYSPIVAFDNLEGAADVYGFRLPRSPKPAVVMGNERHGIARDILSIADYKVQIPMFARGTGNINCLNVAAAAAIALYSLSRSGGAKLQTSAHPARRRPELMLLGGQSHFELGSTIRSAGAFGWERVLLADSLGIWFGADRRLQADGRAAARRHRNPIHLIPTSGDSRYAFAEVCIVTARPIPGSVSIHRTNLAKGTQQLFVIADESTVDVSDEDWNRLGRAVRFVHLDLPRDEFVYHYRLIASIALAEVARQVGQKARTSVSRSKRQGPFYDSALGLLFEEMGEIVNLEELDCY